MKNNISENISNLSKSIRPYRGEMAAAILSALFKQGTVIAAAGITSYIVGLALSGTLGDRSGTLIAVLLVCVLLRALSYFGEMYFAHDVAFKVIRNFRLDLYEKICEVSPAYTLRKKTGQLGQAIVADVEVLELFLAHTFSTFFIALVVTLIIAVVLWQISPVMVMLMLLAALLLVSVPYAVRKRSQKVGATVREDLAEGNSALVESVQGLREIITLRSEGRFRDKVRTRMQKLYDSQYSYGTIKGTEMMMNHVISGLFTAAVMATAAVLVSRGNISMAMYPVTVMLSTVVLGPVNELTTIAQELGLVFAASNRIQHMLTLEPTVKDEGTETAPEGDFRVVFDHVSFSYGEGESEEPVLDDVSFSIDPDETVVLVGHTGAGKSTCANLLLRYWDPDAGQITVGGRDLRDYRISAVRKMISAVQQETYLFHTSVRDNIRIGRLDATDEEIVSASVKANAEEFIDALPEGYDTVTGERGFRLSGGQRQRIAIARALLRDAPIVIFDEAVSSLDTENEKYLQETLRTQLEGKTVLMIAHRLSTIVAADKIVMLENGRVVATGSHEELLATSGPYRNLIGKQLENVAPV